MTLWNVTAPTLRTVGNEEVRGTQTWVVQARRNVDAVRQVITRAAGEDAVRHRRGAVIDPSALSATRWTSPNGPLGPTSMCPRSPWSGSLSGGRAHRCPTASISIVTDAVSAIFPFPYGDGLERAADSGQNLDSQVYYQ
ncbi:hypothetical protein [Streptomyces xantholiticus]|uniref:Uncharacterized protein n=1 Tax=Streptomyces xantholiticus TaxID=68285 RepID=A0ABV1UNG7_9ACTN